MAVKMYAWFTVVNPLYPLLGASLNDGVAVGSEFEDQSYIKDSENITGAIRATQAINYVGNVGMAIGNDATLFLARYALGNYNGIFDAHSGELQQQGSKWWAQPTNYTDQNGAVTVSLATHLK